MHAQVLYHQVGNSQVLFWHFETLSVVLCPLKGTLPASWGSKLTLLGLTELRLQKTEI